MVDNLQLDMLADCLPPMGHHYMLRLRQLVVVAAEQNIVVVLQLVACIVDYTCTELHNIVGHMLGTVGLLLDFEQLPAPVVLLVIAVDPM